MLLHCSWLCGSHDAGVQAHCRLAHCHATPHWPQGAFAEAQAQFLEPSPSEVDVLVGLLSSKKIGVVAHFYMDPQVRVSVYAKV